MRPVFQIVILLLLSATNASGQLPVPDWDFEDGYESNLLYVHSTANYAWDLESQFEWERRQFAGNALRVNTGSVSSDRLSTDTELRLNGALNDRWRLSARFDRLGARERPVTTEQLLLGFEGAITDSHAVFVNVNPEYDKSALDVAIGYGFYAAGREQYVRVALLLDDMNFGSKNNLGGSQAQDPLAVDWQARWRVHGGWYVYTEGRWGTGHERSFADERLSPNLVFDERRDNRAELRLSKTDGQGQLSSVWTQWADFHEARRYRQADFNYRYENQEWRVAGEHVQVVADRHRWRFLLNLARRKAASEGFNAHRLRRRDLTGGVFYEYLWPNRAFSLAYVAGLPDIDYQAPEPADSYDLGDYADKVIVGWRYRFSEQAQLRASVSHEVSVQGFGGGAVQFEWFF